MARVQVLMTLSGLVSVLILLWTATLTDGGDIHVTCVFSEDCVLPCSFQPGSDEVIHWLKPEDKDLTVHSYYYSRDQLKQQSQPYRGRTALFNDQIPKGNASLLLRGLTLQDQGRYKCYTSTINGNKKSFINIAVEAPVRLVDIKLTSDDIITCSSTGIYPEPKLTWSTEPPSDLSFDPGTIQNSTSVKVDDQGLYDITSTKQFSLDRTNICTVTSGTVERTATLKQQAPVQGSTNSEVSIPCRVSQYDLLTFDLTWRFNQTDTILTSTKGTSQMQVDDQWKEQVQSLSDSGSLQLHKLTMVHQGTYSCELSTARDTHLVLTYLEITPDKLSDVSDGLSPGSITGIIIAAAAVIITAVICYLLRGFLPKYKSNTRSEEMNTISRPEEGESLSAAENSNGPNENDHSGILLLNGEEREEDMERQQEQGQGEEGSATADILVPQTEGRDIDPEEDKEERT